MRKPVGAQFACADVDEACRDGELLELGAFAGGDLSCEFPGAGVMGAFQELYRLDLSGNRIYGK